MVLSLLPLDSPHRDRRSEDKRYSSSHPDKLVAYSVCPLEKAYNDTARVGQNVRQHRDPAAAKDFVSFRGRRQVRRFNDNVCFHFASVVLVENTLHCGRYQDLAMKRRKLESSLISCRLKLFSWVRNSLRRILKGSF